MASTHQIKIYTAEGEYVAAVKYAEDAGALLAMRGDGATARLGHAKKDTFWTEGKDGQAGNSYDAVGAAHAAHVAKLNAAWEKRRDSYSDARDPMEPYLD